MAELRRPGIAPPSLPRRFARDARGATAIEYALIAGLIFLVVAGSIRLYAARMDELYGRISTAVGRID